MVPLLSYLREAGVAPAAKPPQSRLEALVAEYRIWLARDRGLAAATVLRYENTAQGRPGRVASGCSVLAGDSPVSALEQALADYLQLRHSLGHDMAEAGRLLPGLVAYLDARGLATVTVEAALDWAQQAPKSPAGRVTTIGPRRMTAARGFARYLSGIDASTEVPPLGLMPRRGPWRQPYIYTSADIGVLLAAARRRIVSPLRAATYYTLIGLLAASGRIGEAIKLDRADADWDQGVLLIRESKFNKTRLVPLHPSCRRWQATPGCATSSSRRPPCRRSSRP
jgi:hypothetical protein